MIFNDLSYYLLFLLPTVVVFHRVGPVAREYTLAIAGSAFFLYYAHRYFGGWPAAACLGLFCVELATSRLYKTGSRWCIWGVVQAVLILLVFKYTNFFLSTAGDVAALWHGKAPDPIRSLFLPLGISFFTFEFIHYAVDVYTGKQVPGRFSRYAAFILFFPTMVAGPIKRFSQFGPKLASARLDAAMVERGFSRILAGLCKKQVVADSFSLWSDKLNTPALYAASRLEVLGWIFAYGSKIYFDFSGYSDIAIGSGYLFGIEVPENFDYPYLRTNITEFWRHWHISLYQWIVDYIFIPLGGSRASAIRVATNTLVAFLISGLWHGAGINFALWGLWHGILLVIHRQWRRVRPAKLDESMAWTFVSWALTLFLVMLGWAFFCMDSRRALYALARVMCLR